MSRGKFWSGWLAPSRPRPAPRSGDGRHRSGDAQKDEEESDTGRETVDETRRLLRHRLGQAPAPVSEPRVQKNLSIARSDAARMAALARRDGRSQARLIGAALDCYERSYGRLDVTPEE